ncbi:type II toxin-antitoxin system HicA family toxin [Megalodesulfovibrio gigas]|nr:type II toxin-antitoxin system HicA family toxin [Megalodesulfovibrio gigas]
MTSREIIKLLKAHGWVHVRTVGDHFQFKHPGTATPPALPR